MKKLILAIFIVAGCAGEAQQGENKTDLSIEPVTDSTDYSLEKLVQHIEERGGYDLELFQDRDALRHTGPDVEALFFPARGSLLVRDLRGYDAKEETPLDDDVLAEQAKEIVRQLGASERELEDIHVRYLSAWSREVDPARGEKIDAKMFPITHRRMAKKVFINRTLDGVEVLGDRLVVSFALDGTFRKVIGRWREVDWHNSQLETLATKGDLMAAADRYADDHDLDNAENVRTCLEPMDKSKRVVTLRLVGCLEQRHITGATDLHTFEI